MTDLQAGRRDLVLASLLGVLPSVLTSGQAEASQIDPVETIIRLPNQIAWQTHPDFPPSSVEMAPLFGALNSKGLYYILIRWHPGYMSAPHTYITDRLCVVVSGTWWVNSGADFDPASTVPAPAGTFVRRVAHTPHYDGVRRDGTEPAVIALCGMGPVGQKWVDPGKPGWRRV